MFNIKDHVPKYKKRSLRVFLTAFLAMLLLCAAGYVFLVLRIGKDGIVKSDKWLLDVQRVKTHLVRNTRSPKIVILAGSGSYFSVNSRMIEEVTGMPVINFARHAAIPLRFFIYEVEQYLNEGDILVMPLETVQFYQEDPDKIFTDFSISFLLGHSPEYLRCLTVPEKFRLFFCYGTTWINQCLMGQIKYSQFSSREERIASWRKLMTCPSPFGYEYKYMNQYGDSLVSAPLKTTDFSLWRKSFPKTISPVFLHDFAKLQKLAKDKKIKLLLTLPSLYHYVSEANDYEAFKRALKESGIDILGRPEAFSFPSVLYHDTEYHMNETGAMFNTHELLKLILHEINPEQEKKFSASPWAHVVFSEHPENSFPGVKSIRKYETGVWVGQKNFPMALRLPRELQGNNLELELVSKPEPHQKPVFTAIRSGNTECAFLERLRTSRLVSRIEVPASCTGSDTLHLSCSLSGGGIGMERIFIRKSNFAQRLFRVAEDAQCFNFRSGFSVREDWGRWTDGPQADFSIAVPPGLQGKNLEMVWTFLAFLPKERPVCEVEVFVSGEKVADWKCKDFNSRMKLRVPMNCTDKDWLPITLRFKKTVSPKECKLYEDSRKLGIGLKSILLTEG